MSEELVPMEPWLEPAEAKETKAEPVPVEEKKKRRTRKRGAVAATESTTAAKLIEFDPPTLSLIKQVAKAYGWSDSKVIKQAVKASLEPLVVNGKIDTDSPGVVAFWKKAIQ